MELAGCGGTAKLTVAYCALLKVQSVLWSIYCNVDYNLKWPNGLRCEFCVYLAMNSWTLKDRFALMYLKQSAVHLDVAI